MKKLICLFILIIAGCGGNNESNQAPQKLVLKFPLACVLWQDCTIAALPDIDGDGKDALCGNAAYPGHTGTDFATTWEKMDSGLNVVASSDGVVLFAFDGKYDRCVSDSTDPDCANPVSARRAGLNEGNTVCSEMGNYCNGAPCYYCASAGNYLVIRHSSGRLTLYGHLAKSSVAVKVGDNVLQGEAIGRLGSSGASNGPHLHFEVLDSDMKSVDPWLGACNPLLNESLWSSQATMYNY